MEAKGVILDAFGRIRESVHNALRDLSVEELHREPHPPIGWLAWRITRSSDSQLSRLAGLEQVWLADGWHARFNMPPNPTDFGPGHTHTREQVASFRAPDAKTLLAYDDTVIERFQPYLEALTPQELDRVLDEPRFQPLPTVSVRLVSILHSHAQLSGQIAYLRSLHRVGGWFPREGS